MKRKILKRYNRIISVLLSLLGIGGAFTFSGCEGGGNTPGAEYGTPHATFKIYGKVTSEDSAEIPNIKVVMPFDSTYTDEKGNYNLEVVAFPMDQDFSVRFKDIDGSTNGSYQLKDTIVSFEDPQFVNGNGSWNAGETSKKVDIKLKEDK